MRIAVASEGLDVSSHFGCCTNFNFYQVENGELVDSRNLPSQGHLCGSQANFLRQIEVKVLLCGTISEKDAESMKLPASPWCKVHMVEQLPLPITI